MHVWTRLKEESKGVTGQGIYADGMVEHDGMVGQMLAKLDELGIADNTIVMYSTDNGVDGNLQDQSGLFVCQGVGSGSHEHRQRRHQTCLQEY